MSDKTNRVVLPGSFGSPFFEPSLSMGSGGAPVPSPDRFFDIGAMGGTDFSAALALLHDLPRDAGGDRYSIVITDGDPGEMADLSARAPVDALAQLIASLKPGEQLVCLDYSGALPVWPGEDGPRVIASRPA